MDPISYQTSQNYNNNCNLKIEDIAKMKRVLSVYQEHKPEVDKAIASLPLNEENKTARLAIDMLLNMVQEIGSVSFGNEPNMAGSTILNSSQKQMTHLKFFKAVFQTSFKNKSQLDERDIRSIREFISTFSDIYHSQIITDNQKVHLVEWMKEIFECQQLFRPFLPSTTHSQGDSKGFLFKIKKNGDIYGWVFGTIHDLITPNMRKAAHICDSIYKKLHQCSIIGTEVKLIEGSDGGSVENQLIQYAQSNGIVNVGLDTQYRDFGTFISTELQSKEEMNETAIQGSLINYAQEHGITNVELNAIDPSLWQMPQKSTWTRALETMDIEKICVNAKDSELKTTLLEYNEQKKKTNMLLDKIAQSYQEGNIAEFKQLYSPSDSVDDIEQKRQETIIKNMDACLHAIEEVRQLSKTDLLKAFFPIGSAHVLYDQLYTKTILTGLADLGWEVELDNVG